MKSNIINALASAMLATEKALTLEAARFEDAARAVGIVITYDKEGKIKVKSTKALALKLIKEVNKGFDAAYGEERTGNRKNLDNRFCILRKQYGIDARSTGGGNKSKYSKRDIAKTVEFVQKSFKLEADEVAAFLFAAAKAAKKSAE